LIPIATGDLLHEIDDPMAHRVVRYTRERFDWIAHYWMAS
jgi:hypothetical protein